MYEVQGGCPPPIDDGMTMVAGLAFHSPPVRMAVARPPTVVAFSGGIRSCAALWWTLNGAAAGERTWLFYGDGHATNDDAQRREQAAVRTTLDEARDVDGMPMWDADGVGVRYRIVGAQCTRRGDVGELARLAAACARRVGARRVVWGGEAPPTPDDDVAFESPPWRGGAFDAAACIVEAARRSWHVHAAQDDEAAPAVASGCALQARLLSVVHSCPLRDGERLPHAVHSSPLLAANCVGGADACARCAGWAATMRDVMRADEWLRWYAARREDVDWRELPHIDMTSFERHRRRWHLLAGVTPSWFGAGGDTASFEGTMTATTADNSSLMTAEAADDDDDDVADGDQQQHAGGGDSLTRSGLAAHRRLTTAPRRANRCFDLDATVRRMPRDRRTAAARPLPGEYGDAARDGTADDDDGDAALYDFDENGSQIEVQAYDEEDNDADGSGGRDLY